jgi:hypothetical protein
MALNDIDNLTNRSALESEECTLRKEQDNHGLQQGENVGEGTGQRPVLSPLERARVSAPDGEYPHRKAVLDQVFIKIVETFQYKRRNLKTL